MMTVRHPASRSAGFALTLVLALLLTGCGGDGPAPVNNLSVLGVELRTAPDQVYIGHPLELVARVSSQAPAENVALSLYLLDRAGVDAESEGLVQHMIGTVVFPSLGAGTVESAFSFAIAAENLDPDTGEVSKLNPGDYYLAAHVDPARLMSEWDESDNDLLITDQTVTLRATELPNLRVDDLEMNEPVAVLHADEGSSGEPVEGFDDDPDEHFDAVLTLSCTGAQSVGGIMVTAYAELGASGERLPLLLWNSAIDPETGAEIGSYQITLDIAELQLDTPRAVHLEFHVPSASREALLAWISAHGEYDFEVVVIVDEQNAVAEHGAADDGGVAGKEDNEIARPIAFLPPLPPGGDTGPVLQEENYKKAWGNKAFGARLSSSSRTGVDEAGVRAGKDFAVPVNALGLAFDFFEVSARAAHDPSDTESSDFHFVVSVLGADVLTIRGEEGFTISAACSEDPKDLTEGLQGLCFVKTKKWGESEPPYMLGTVPVKVERSIAAGLVVELDATIGPTLKFRAGPHAFLRAGIEAKVELGVIEVGVGGELTLLDAGVFAECTVTSSRVGCDPPFPGCALIGELEFEVVSDVSGLHGELFLFVDLPEIKWCWYGPCALRKLRIRKVLIDAAVYEKRDVLLGPYSSPFFVPL